MEHHCHPYPWLRRNLCHYICFHVICMRLVYEIPSVCCNDDEPRSFRQPTQTTSLCALEITWLDLPNNRMAKQTHSSVGWMKILAWQVNGSWVEGWYGYQISKYKGQTALSAPLSTAHLIVPTNSRHSRRRLLRCTQINVSSLSKV